MNECAIYEGEQTMGRLTWKSDGLRWHFQAKIRRYEGIRYLWLTDTGGMQVRLGVPQPTADGMVLVRTLTQQGLDGLCPEQSCRALLCGSDEPPAVSEPADVSDVPAAPAADEATAAHEPMEERLTAIVFRENGRLYVGEPFEVGKALVFGTAFRKMIFREIDGMLHWLLEIG